MYKLDKSAAPTAEKAGEIQTCCQLFIMTHSAPNTIIWVPQHLKLRNTVLGHANNGCMAINAEVQ